MPIARAVSLLAVLLLAGPSHAEAGRLQALGHSIVGRVRSSALPLVRGCQGVCNATRRLRQSSAAQLRRLGDSLRGTRESVVRSKLVQGSVGAAKGAATWARKHPGKAIGIGLGAAAMFGVVFYAAPAVSAGISACLAPTIGETAAGVVGTATGGALACGSRSLLVHSTPMILGVDPFNARQLAADVGMSSGFGFGGFAQAATLRTVTRSVGASGLGLFVANYLGLVGYELAKDYLQNRIRNRVASDPKRFRDIWKSALLMETASNLHRCIPGLNLEANFGAKIVGDLGGTIWWDRIINRRNATKRGYVRDVVTE